MCSLKMALDTIILHLNVENCLTIFSIVARDFQRVLQNTQQGGTAPPCKKEAPAGAPELASIVTQSGEFGPPVFKSKYTFAWHYVFGNTTRK